MDTITNLLVETDQCSRWWASARSRGAGQAWGAISMDAPVRELPPLVSRTRAERVRMALGAALMARDNAQVHRRIGNTMAARDAYWRAVDYLNMARRWGNAK